MQHTLKILFFVLISFWYLGTTQNTQAQSTQNEAVIITQTIYKIRIMAAQNPDLTDFKSLEEIGKLYIEVANKGLSRVVMGDYYHKEDANKILEVVKKAGYKTAYVATEKVKLELLPPKDKVIKKLFAIQIGAYKHIVYDNFAELESLGNLYSEEGGKLKKVLVGPFNTRKEAETALKSVIKQGYNAAFIRSLDAGVAKKN